MPALHNTSPALLAGQGSVLNDSTPLRNSYECAQERGPVISTSVPVLGPVANLMKNLEQGGVEQCQEKQFSEA